MRERERDSAETTESTESTGALQVTESTDPIEHGEPIVA